MTGGQRDRLIAYIKDMEEAICGEYCASEPWPVCTEPRHDEGNALLEVVKQS